MSHVAPTLTAVEQVAEHIRSGARTVAAHLTQDAATEYLALAEQTIADGIAFDEERLTPGQHAIRAKARVQRKRQLVRECWVKA